MQCNPVRINDEYRCDRCGFAWGIEERKPECKRHSLAEEIKAEQTIQKCRELLD